MPAAPVAHELAGQGRQLPLGFRAALYCPAAHSKHTLLLVAPRAELYDPPVQAMQAEMLVDPVPVPYVLAPQIVQVLDARPVAYVPARQFVQTVLAVAPSVVENEPTRQSAHALDETPPNPVWNVPAKQLWQLALVVAPRVLEKDPARQSEHDPDAVSPRPVWKVPALHNTHDDVDPAMVK